MLRDLLGYCAKISVSLSLDDERHSKPDDERHSKPVFTVCLAIVYAHTCECK